MTTFFKKCDIINLMLNDAQLKLIAEILKDLGIIFVAGMVLPVFSGRQNIFAVVSGIMAASLFWVFAILILRKERGYHV